MAREQVKEGAHVLDVCVDYVGRDGTARHGRDRGPVRDPGVAARSCSTRPSRRCSKPACSTTAARRILNSANLEEGEDEGKRMDRVFRLAREYGAAVICLTIDEEGQARTAEWKLRVAKRIYDIAIERYGLEPTDLIFDALTFPLSTGDDDLRRDAMETIEAIRRIKAELPGRVAPILGLSNVSFGLKPAARHVLNSVFLHECREAGLDAAIVHAARIMPLHRIDERAEGSRARPHLRPPPRRTTTRSPSSWRCSRTSKPARSRRKTARAGRSSERLKHRIIDGDRDGLEADLDEAARRR